MVWFLKTLVSLAGWERTAAVSNWMDHTSWKVGWDHTVDVSGTASVMAREDGLELGNTIPVGLLQASKECLVQVGRVIGVTIAAGLDTRVNTLYAC